MSAAIPMELAEATESTHAGGAGPEGQPRLQFSLVFRGPLEPVLPQAIYGLEHDALGHLDLFLVPIGPAEGGDALPGVLRLSCALSGVHSIRR